MKLLITGGCGFLGSNLASEALKRGIELCVLDNLSRRGSVENLKWLESLGSFKFTDADVRLTNDVERVVQDFKPDALFHLSGQVAMTTSIADPRKDFETNVLGGFNVLEAIRKFQPETPILFSSTNKVYGDLEEFTYVDKTTRYEVEGQYAKGFDESLRLDFRSPYGCSKGAADQYMLDYARIFNLKTVVFRHSSISGGRQFATYDQGWVAWFVQQALLTQEKKLKEPFTISGDGKQVRDILFSEDIINCYFDALRAIDKTKGQAFNIGGGIENSYSLLELFKFLESELDTRLNYKPLPWRASDQKVFVANTAKAQKTFGFAVKIKKEEGVRKLISWVSESAAR